MRQAVGLLFLPLLLAACGGDSTQRGSVAWDAGSAVIEVTGRGAYALELNNNGSVEVEHDAGTGKPARRLAPGDSVRVRGEEPAVHRFRLLADGKARIDYRLVTEADVHVDSRAD